MLSGIHGARQSTFVTHGSVSVFRNSTRSLISSSLSDSSGIEKIPAALLAANLAPENAEVTFNASTTVQLGRDDAEKLLRLVDALEDLDDVQEVYTNADIPAEIYEKLD